MSIEREINSVITGLVRSVWITDGSGTMFVSNSNKMKPLYPVLGITFDVEFHCEKSTFNRQIPEYGCRMNDEGGRRL